VQLALMGFTLKNIEGGDIRYKNSIP